MGSAFTSEPREWFEGITEPIVMFVMADPSMVMHARWPECDREDPHRDTECGLM